MSTGRSILVLNSGSSSVKFALYDVGASLTSTLRGEIQDIDSTPRFCAADAKGVALSGDPWFSKPSTEFALILDALLAFVEDHLADDALIAVGHRVVHGGPHHIAPQLINPELLESLEILVPLAPLHLPHNLTPIRALIALRPALPQVVCFDTAFHHTMPREAAHYALPRALTESGLRQYGFHGLSYEYIVQRLKAQAPVFLRGKVIAAHLGAGASLCALQGGVSVATTMGFSVLDGLMMATRCGTLDPGAIFYLARQGKSFVEIEDMLYRHSGLLGVSGISGDMRVLSESADPHAREALELFTYRVALQVGALASALGGVNGIVFTAGIGEHAPAIRTDICLRLAWLGVRLDARANAANAYRISASDSLVEVRVIATDEEVTIARHTEALLAAVPPA